MGFKPKQIKIDLSLDLTDYIPGEAGKINSNKITPSQILEWSKFSARQADILNDKKDDASNEDLIDLSCNAIIAQIDWFYEKGADYWKMLPLPVLKELLEYIQKEVISTEKK